MHPSIAGVATRITKKSHDVSTNSENLSIAPSSRQLMIPKSAVLTGGLTGALASAPHKSLVKHCISALSASVDNKTIDADANYNFSSEAEKQRHLNAGLYCQCTYIEEGDIEKLGQNDESIAWLKDKFSDEKAGITLSEEDARNMLTMLDTRLTTTAELQEQFSLLDESQATEMLDLMGQTDTYLHKDHDSGELVFVARGTQNSADLKQDVMTGLGQKGSKYQANEKLIQLAIEGSASTDEYPKQVTGHSLGGGMALAASKAFGEDSDRKTIVFDTQALNHKQNSAFNNLTESSGGDVGAINYRIKSKASLGAGMKSPILFDQPDTTVRLKNKETFMNPVKELQTNHKIGTIMNEIREIPVSA